METTKSILSGTSFVIREAIKTPLKVIVSIYRRSSRIIVKPWPQTLSPKTQKPKTKGHWADTKIL